MFGWKHVRRCVIAVALLVATLALTLAVAADPGPTTVFLPYLPYGDDGTLPEIPARPPLTPTTAPAPDITAIAPSNPEPSVTPTVDVGLPVVTPSTMPTMPPTVTSVPTATETIVPPAASIDISGIVSIWPEHVSTPDTIAPRQFVVVLDVSGSMNTNFDGQGMRDGRVFQCANGPAGAPRSLNCGRPDYAWEPVEERRIYVAKQAVEHFIGQLNMPGNPSYDASRPADQMQLVWFNSQVPLSNTSGEWRSDPAVLINEVRTAGRTYGDSYKTQGGTNGAAGLYRASTLFESAAPTVLFNNREYRYGRDVIFVTDGVSNTFLDVTKSDLSGGRSDASTYPADHPCRVLGVAVIESAACQTTEFGGQYNAMDRPITQMVNVSRELLQVRAGADVFVVALSNIPATGLKSGVASSPSSFYAVETLSIDANGKTSVDRAFDDVLSRQSGQVCEPQDSGWTSVVPPGRVSTTTGTVSLYVEAKGATLQAPIVVDANGALSYSFADVPLGAYQLSAHIVYTGDDGVARTYDQIVADGEEQARLRIVPDEGATLLQVDLKLKLAGSICAGP